jgi:tripartite-type tricarboxylate transporter receptor subunit TctC
MRTFWIAAAAVALIVASGGARADAVEDFYKGKQVTMLLSAGTGGGYDTYARVFAPHFTRLMRGHPALIVQSMPGGGGIRAMNHLFATAPQDGTTIGLVHSAVPFAPVYGLDGAKYDSRQFHWLGSMNNANAMCVAWHDSGVKSWQDLFDKEFIVGGTGAGSQMETLPAMLNKLFGTHIKIISGYRGGNEVFLAMERGEVHGRCGGLVGSINSTRPDWFPQKKVEIPIMVSMERNPRFPDVPTVLEFVKDERTRSILNLVLAPQEIDRPVLAPPGVPADRLKALREAFAAIVKDPAFLADAEKAKLDVDPGSAEKVAKIIATAYASPPEIIEAANDAMNMRGGGGE